jgi:hypothetical protein
MLDHLLGAVGGLQKEAHSICGRIGYFRLLLREKSGIPFITYIGAKITPRMPTAYTVGYGAGQLIALLTFLVPAILFLRTQQNVLSAIWPENRRMHPGLVWLQLVPLFNYVWVFFVVRRIADSLAKQYAAFQSDSVFGIPDEAAIKAIGKKPTYGIGLAYCLLLFSMPLTIIFFNLFNDSTMAAAPSRETSVFYLVLGLSMMALVLACMVCWIIYWVQLAACKKKLIRFAVA